MANLFLNRDNDSHKIKLLDLTNAKKWECFKEIRYGKIDIIYGGWLALRTFVP